MSEVELGYKENADAVIRDLLLEFECQPILFVGSGLSRRYFGAPDWLELLRQIATKLPDGSDKFQYLRQKYSNDPIDIGTALSELIFEWAWSTAKDIFPTEMFLQGLNKDIFLKYLVGKHFEEITPGPDRIQDVYKKEIDSLVAIRPHAIITTNYDLFLEGLLDGYETVTGQTIIKYNTNSFGEIYHIHGDITETKTLVLTKSDYEEWAKKKKYVSAKLLTYFAEHPVFIFGYGMNDPNVKAILRDIGELVASEDGYIKNVVQVFWHSKLPESPADQAVVSLDGSEFRVRAVHTTDFRWIFDALKSRSALTSVNPKLVRALAARAMKLVRHDIPAGTVKVDYDVLERVAANEDELPKLLGISIVSNANESHPFIMSQVAKRLKVSNWQQVNKIVHRIIAEKNVDIRSSDNKYHCRIKTGKKDTSYARKWSQLAVDLFLKVKVGEAYELDM
jgi:hypothetical protein